MPTKTPASTAALALAPEITSFLAAKEHPLEEDIQKVRARILGVDPSIREEIKWNSVSFRNEHDFFATIHLRSVETVQVVLYTGVQKKATAESGVPVEDPRGLIDKWQAKDRCLVSLGAGSDLDANLPAFASLIEGWIEHVR